MTTSDLSLAAPHRSLEQRLRALQRANDIRSARALLKGEVKSGKVNAVDLLLAPTKDTESWKVFDLLLCTPKIGRVKASKMLATVRLSPSKTVGGITDRQRRELAVQLRRYNTPSTG